MKYENCRACKPRIDNTKKGNSLFYSQFSQEKIEQEE